MATETETSEFPVQWDNPADADLTWRFDPLHAPDVVTPLGFDLYMQPFLRGFGILRACLQNYYMYMYQPPMPRGGPSGLTPEMLSAGARRWRDEIIPEVAGFDEHYRCTDFEGMTPEELATELDRLIDVRVRCGQLHTMATLPWWLGMTQLIETYHELTGGNDLGALRLVQGYGNKSVEAGEALWRVARIAASTERVRERLLSGADRPANELLAALNGDPEARPFLQAFRAYLDEFGWRSGMFEMAEPTWAEEPRFPLNQLRAYLQMPDYDPVVERERLAAERHEAVQEALEGLSPEEAKRLEAAIGGAVEVAPILEDHNYYIDQRVGVLPRRLVLSAGRRLATGGALAEPEDVFYLRHAELREALLGPTDDLRPVASQRRDEVARWSKVRPPAFIGAPPPEDPSAGDEPDRFWGGANLRSELPDELKGNSASAGVARGPARVLLSLDEAHRFGPGDVLVARTTAPPWTPLFAIAAAIVTETGGVLSHAAVVAREYGVPAVLNVGGATRLIRDGQPLEVDGSQGIVRILS